MSYTFWLKQVLTSGIMILFKVESCAADKEGGVKRIC